MLNLILMIDEDTGVPRTGVLDPSVHHRFLYHFRKCYVQPICVAFTPYLDDGYISEAERRALYADAFGRFQPHRKRNYPENPNYRTLSKGRSLFQLVNEERQIATMPEGHKYFGR